MTKRTRLILCAVTAAAGLGACGSSSAPKLTAPQLLARAKSTLDAASAVKFQLSSVGVTGSSLELVGGSGDIVRNPVSIQGTFTLSEDGIQVSAKVVSVGSTFEAQLPFHTGYEKTSPASFGLTNPAQLLNAQTGLTSLLTLAEDPTLGASTRVNGELLDSVSFTVPGNSVPVIPDEAPSKPVSLTVGIDSSSYQLRTVTLTGAFTSATSTSTYTVTLTDYNEHVTITLPPATS